MMAAAKKKPQPESPAQEAAAGMKRKKTPLRDRFEALLAMPSLPEDLDGDNADAMCAALLKKALAGDMHAFAAIRDSIGEKPADKREDKVDGEIVLRWK